MNTNNLKKYIPHIAAILIFLAIILMLFLPMLQDKVIVQGDIVQGKGMAKEITDFRVKTGEEALWTNNLFSGMPAYQISVRDNGDLIKYVYEIVTLGLPRAASITFLCFLGFYVLMLCLRVNPWVGIIGAIAYGLASYTIISMEAGHNTKVHVIALMPAVVGGVLLAYNRSILLGAAITCLSLSMALSANHVQIVYYLLFIVLGVGIVKLYEASKEGKLPHFGKTTGVLVLAAMLAVTPNISKLWTTYEYAKDTMRGGSSELTHQKEQTSGGLTKEYAMRWSYGILESFTILIPSFKGGASGGELNENSEFFKELRKKGVPKNQAQQYIQQVPTYWGDQPFTSGPTYFGAVICFLFILGLFVVKSPLKWGIVGLTVLSFLFGWGKNLEFFSDIVFNNLPFYNKFRTPAMALVIAQLMFPLLGMLALREMLDGTLKKYDLIKSLKYAAGVSLGIVLVFGIVGSYVYDFKSAQDQGYIENGQEWIAKALQEDRASLLRMDALRSIVFIVLGAGLIWAYLQGKVKQSLLIGGLGLIIFIDLFTVDRRFFNEEDFVRESAYKKQFQPTRADLEILQDPDPYYRVFNYTRNPFNDALTSYHHKSVGGYHPAKLVRYQDMIDFHISKSNMKVFNMLNTKYFIVEDKSSKAPKAQYNPEALGNAWFVENIKWVPNADEEIDALNNFAPASTAVIDERYKEYMSGFTVSADTPSDNIELTEYSPKHLKYKSSANTSRFAVFSEVYYNSGKGWHAYIDGDLVEHIRVNYILRGLKIPAGQHTIEFKFEPRSYQIGKTISLAGSVVLLLFVGGSFAYAIRKR